MELLHGDYARALARQNPQIVDEACRTLLRRRGIPIEPDSDDYREAAMAVWVGQILDTAGTLVADP